MVLKIRAAAGSRSRIAHVPVFVARVAAGCIGLAVRDVLVTDHELGGLMGELACTDGPSTGETGFSGWVETEGGGLGLRYASEIARHFDRRRDSPR